MAQLVKSLPSNHKVPSSIPENLCDLHFRLSGFTEKGDSALHHSDGREIEYQLTWDGLVSSPGRVKYSHLLNTIQKLKISAGTTGTRLEKGFSYRQVCGYF